jgi:RNA polymerase sigma-70 factor, ECF subfamily
MPRLREPDPEPWGRGRRLQGGRDDEHRSVSDREADAVEDAALLAAVASRDKVALEVLYIRYRAVVYTIGLRITGDRELAEDVLQDVFFRCWQRAGTFRPDRGRVGPWLMSMARNRAVDLLRGRQQEGRLREAAALSEQLHTETAANLDEEVIVRHDVAAALSALPREQREAIELAYYGGMTHKEVAAYLGAPLGTVKTRIRDGMGRLRCLLRPHLEPGWESRRGGPEDV